MKYFDLVVPEQVLADLMVMPNLFKLPCLNARLSALPK